MVMMDDRPADLGRGQLLDVLRTINQLQEQLRAARDPKPRTAEPIAIVGRALRMPGGASTPDGWWPLLRDAVDATGEFPPDRGDAADYHHPDPDHPGTAHVIRGGFLDKIDGFDPAVFGISPREATGMDPQQRMALELCWEALEDAAIAPDSLTDSDTGVFIGVSTTDYVRMRQRLGDMRDIDAYQLIGEPSFIAGRISYTLGLQGPSCVVDTACSSSLVALHQGVRSLRLGETNLALVGGINLLLDPYGFVLMSKFRALSPDGRCKTFDDSADGYARGEGGGIFALQRLSDAVAERRVIHGVIAGTAVNHDGRSSGMTVPNPESQQKLMRSALVDAGLSAHDIDYVEAHGTGTALGDPIELRSIHAVYGAGRPTHAPVVVGSVKSNIGHLEPAAGAAGLAKVLLALDHQQIPPNLHLHSGNSKVDWDRLAVTVPTSTRDWAPTERPRIAAISSFGASGTNAHTIITEAPARAERASIPERPEAMLLSARTPTALRVLAERYVEALTIEPGASVADLCWTTQTGRARMQHGMSVTGATWAELRAGLRGYLDARGTPGVHVTDRGAHHQLRTAWMFTGQGSQYPGMASDLLVIPAFADAARECVRLFDQYLELPLADVLWGAEGSHLNDTAYTQPALFTVEYAMAKYLQAAGITPSALIGHSIGEIAAATVAGVLTLPDATRLVAARGRLMSALPSGGAMLAVSTSEAELLAVLGTLPSDVAIAAVNSPSDVVLSGAAPAISTVAKKLTAAKVRVTPLTVSHAFHSPLLDPMIEAFRAELAQVQMSAPEFPLISSVTGQWWDERCATPEYWIEQARGTVRFADGMATLAEDGTGIFLEVGPHPVLTGLGQRCLPAEALDSQLWAAPLRRGGNDRAELMSTLARLHQRGLPIDWRTAHADADVAHTTLPTYPWERERYWFRAGNSTVAHGPATEGLGHQLASATPTWQDTLAAPVPSEDVLAWVVSRAVRAARQTGHLVGNRVELSTLVLHQFPSPDASYPQLVQTSVETDGAGLRVVLRGAAAEQAAAEAPWTELAEVAIGGFGRATDVEHPADVTLFTITATDATEVVQQILAACLPANTPENIGAASIGGFDSFSATTLTEITSVAVRHNDESTDAWLLDADGRVVGRLSGLRQASGAQHAPWYPQEELVLVPAWQQLADDRAPLAAPAGPMLLVGGPDLLAAALSEGLSGAGARVQRLTTAELDALVARRSPLPGCAIVLLDGTLLPTADAVTTAALQDHGLPIERRALAVTRWLSAHPDAAGRLSLVTRGAVRTSDEQLITGAAGAPLWGLGRVLALEHYANWGGLLDLDPSLDLADCNQLAGAIPTLVTALLSGHVDDQQAQRGSLRLGARVRRDSIPAAPKNRPLLTAPGTVLITGGLGGIGLALIDWCARRGVSRVVVTSRSAEPLPDTPEAATDRWAAVSTLRAHGIDLRVEAVDVTDGDAMAELVRRLAADPELPLRGVVHAAGVSEPQFVVDVEDAAYQRVWAPKVLGGWGLHEATKDLDLDLFVLFSSIASSWGSQHLASYAAGNAFLDALADTRAAAGLPVTTIAWGPWELPSSLFGQDVLDFLTSVGLRQLAADQCLNLLGNAIAAGRASQIVCAADWSRYRPVMEARSPRPILHDIAVHESEENGSAAAALETVLAAGERGGAPAQRAAMSTVLAGIVCGVLGLARDSVTEATDVFALGLDSIMVMEVTAGCRRELGLVVSPSVLFERSTLGEWSSHLVGMLGVVGDGDGGPGVDSSLDTSLEQVDTLAARSVLPADIQPQQPGGSGLGGHVLLTGATGFVGAYLLRELLESDHARTVSCLVRGGDEATARQRILDNAAVYFPAETINTARVRIVSGDLAEPGLGLDADARDRILSETDSIVHNGAWVHFAHTYDQLEAANVTGTVELLRLAALGGIPLHHVSTYGIWGLPTDDRDEVYEDDSILTSGRLVTGYVQTKWAAEHVVKQAAECGVSTAIYRLGRVLGDSVTGAALTTHFTCRVIKSCIQLGFAPELDITVEMTPVDYVARSLVSIAANSVADGSAYHLVNPIHLPFRQLVDTISERGWKVATVPPQDWFQRLLDTQGIEPNDLHSVLPTVQELIVGGERAVDYDTKSAVSALAGSGISCPPLDRALLDRYFDYFLATGYLSAPEQAPANPDTPSI